MNNNVLELVDKIKKKDGLLTADIEDTIVEFSVPVDLYEEILVLLVAAQKQNDPIENKDYGIDESMLGERLLRLVIKYISKDLSNRYNLSFEDAKRLVVTYSDKFVLKTYKALGLISEEQESDLKKKVSMNSLKKE